MNWAFVLLVVILFSISTHTWKMSTGMGWIGSTLGAIATFVAAGVLTILVYMAVGP